MLEQQGTLPDGITGELIAHIIHLRRYAKQQLRMLKEDGNIDPEDALVAVVKIEIILSVDSLHERDNGLSIPHHYLSTDGGQKAALGKALENNSNERKILEKLQLVTLMTCMRLKRQPTGRYS